MLSGESNNRKLNRLGFFLPLCPVFVKINLQYLWVLGDLQKLQPLYQYQPGLHWSNPHLGACWRLLEAAQGQGRKGKGCFRRPACLKFLLFTEMILNVTGQYSQSERGLEVGAVGESQCGNKSQPWQTQVKWCLHCPGWIFSLLSLPALYSLCLCLWSQGVFANEVTLLWLVGGVLCVHLEVKQCSHMNKVVLFCPSESHFFHLA